MLVPQPPRPAPEPALLDAGLPGPARGGFVLRSGGFSAGPYASLNLGQHVGDDQGAVTANRELARRAIGANALAFAEQVHGARVAVVTHPAGVTSPAGLAGSVGLHEHAGVDGLVTATPGLALVVLAADCLPVLLADPIAGVIGAAHAGRQGLVDGVLQATLVAMGGLGASLERTVAVLGPAICGGCYELPQALADEVGAQLPASRSVTRQGTASIDLVAGARSVLADAGVGTVRTVGGCTLEQPQRWYSYRRDRRTGRHAGLVVLG